MGQSFENIHHSGKKCGCGRFWQWLLEVLSLIGALLLLCAIVGLLVGYHDNKQPVWKYIISLNSLVALLSTLFKALMTIVVAEGTSLRLFVVQVVLSYLALISSKCADDR